MTVTEDMINRLANNAARLGEIESFLRERLAHYGATVDYEITDLRGLCKCTITCNDQTWTEYGILESTLMMITALEVLANSKIKESE